MPFTIYSQIMLVYILYFMQITKERELTSDSLHDYEPHGWMNTALAAGEKFQSCKRQLVWSPGGALISPPVRGGSKSWPNLCLRKVLISCLKM